MKKVLAVLLFGLSSIAFAGPHGHFGHRSHGHHGGGWGWVVPAIVGGTVVYMATRPAEAAPAPTVIYVPQGMPNPPIGYHYEQLNDANCNCLRWVLVQNGLQR